MPPPARFARLRAIFEFRMFTLPAAENIAPPLPLTPSARLPDSVELMTLRLLLALYTPPPPLPPARLLVIVTVFRYVVPPPAVRIAPPTSLVEPLVNVRLL